VGAFVWNVAANEQGLPLDPRCRYRLPNILLAFSDADGGGFALWPRRRPGHGGATDRGRAGRAPPEAVKLIATWLQAMVQGPTTRFGIGLIISVVFAVWSMWSATGMLMTAVNICYGEERRRGASYRSTFTLWRSLNWRRPANADGVREIQNLLWRWRCPSCGESGSERTRIAEVPEKRTPRGDPQNPTSPMSYRSRKSTCNVYKDLRKGGTMNASSRPAGGW
jgi:hypothetical protein